LKSKNTTFKLPIMANVIKTELTEIMKTQSGATLLPAWIEEMKKDIYPISTTIPAIDNKIGGILGLCVVGGGPGTGKTAFAVQVAENYALQGGPVFYLSFEMGRAGFIGRIFQRVTGLGAKDHRQEIKRNQDAINELQSKFDKMVNLRILELPGINKEFNFEELKEACKVAYEATGLQPLIVVDSLHYTPLPVEYNSLDGKRKIDKSLEIFTDIHQGSGANILMIAHQTKGEIKAGDSSEISFAGSVTIGYAVDIAILLERDDNGEKNLIVKIVKNRWGQKVPGGESVEYNLQKQIIQ
jgi:predicted ATP-dependent serine protease